jgi:hypothetical protein
VYAFAADGGTVYAGGAFRTIGGQPRAKLAALAAATGNGTGAFGGQTQARRRGRRHGSDFPICPRVNSAKEVLALSTESSTHLYAGGIFTKNRRESTGFRAVHRQRVARPVALLLEAPMTDRIAQSCCG